MKKKSFYFFLSLFVLLFGQIYEHFSHGVYSNYMLFAFLFPFLGLFLPSLFGRRADPFLWKCGVASLTVGSLYKGILEIYGTSSYLEIPFFVVGIGLCTLQILFVLLQKRKCILPASFPE